MWRNEWLDTATWGIRFGPDRKTVRAELEAHLEDKEADLRRLYPDLSSREAEARVLREMGDPIQLQKELARVHRPWLGYLWRASQVLLGVVVGAAAVSLAAGTYRSGLSNLAAGPSSRYAESDPPISAIYKGVELDYQGPLEDRGPIQVGEYTFTTDRGELWSVIEGDGVSRVVYVQLEVYHPRPLEPLNLLVREEMWAEDDRGGEILSYQDYYALDNPERGLYEVVHFDRLDSGVFTDRYEVVLEITDRSVRRVDLRYTAMGVDLTIPVSLEVKEP